MDADGADVQRIGNVGVMGGKNKLLDRRVVAVEVRKDLPEMGKDGRCHRALPVHLRAQNMWPQGCRSTPLHISASSLRLQSDVMGSIPWTSCGIIFQNTTKDQVRHLRLRPRSFGDVLRDMKMIAKTYFRDPFQILQNGVDI